MPGRDERWGAWGALSRPPIKEVPMGRLDGKVALISGGAKGQGAVEAKMFVREGASVVFGDILDQDGKRVEGEIRASGGAATYVHLDVTREADWRPPWPPRSRPTESSACS